MAAESKMDCFGARRYDGGVPGCSGAARESGFPLCSRPEAMKMQRQWRLSPSARAWATTAVLCAAMRAALAPSVAAPAAAAPAGVYEAIASRLTPGGDIFAVANMKGVVAECANLFAELGQDLAAQDAPGAGVLAGLGAFLSSCGLEAIGGVGLSVVPRDDGLHDIRSFVGRDPRAAAKPLWMALVGGAPRRLTALDYLPRDAVLAWTSAGEPTRLRELAHEMFAGLGGAAGTSALAAVEAGISRTLGADIAALVAAMEGDSFFALQLDRGNMITLPLPGSAGGDAPAAAVFPAPTLLLGVRMRDDSLCRALAGAFARAGVKSGRESFADVEIVTARTGLAAPAPVPVVFAFAMHEGMFLLGSSAEGVKDAIRARRSGEGLSTAPHFRRLFAGLPAENNGISYVHPDFSLALHEFRQSCSRAAGVPAMARLQDFFGPTNAAASRVIINTSDGILAQGVSTSGGRETMAQLTTAPLALVSAIALPAFMRSRALARRASCIANLLRIEAAKEQWAAEAGKEEGATPTAEEIGRYLPEGRLPTCPQGGEYIIGPPGTKARCTVPGHVLP
jgi:hypothetical protein